MRRVVLARGGALGVWLVVGGALSFLGLATWYYLGQEPVQREITRARLLGGALRKLDASRTLAWRAQDAPRAGMSAITSTREARDGVVVEDRTYVATPGGLLVFHNGHNGAGHTHADRRYEKTLTWLDGLGSTDVTALARLGSHVVVGGSDGSLTELDDTQAQVIQFRPANEAGAARPAAITDLLSDGTLLYAGTYGNGLVVWDGQKAASLATGRDGESLREITAMALSEQRLVLGTAEGLVLVRERDQFVRVAAMGDESTQRDRITALAWEGDILWVGTPLGLLRVDERGQASTFRSATFVTSLLATQGRLYIGTLDEGVILLDAQRAERRLAGRDRIVRIRLLDQRPVAFTTRGSVDLSTEAATPPYETPPESLAGSHVTALAARAGEIWVGTAQDGIDVLDSAGHVLYHLPHHADLPRVHDIVFQHNLALACSARGVIPIDVRGHVRGALSPGLSGEIHDAVSLLGTVAYATPSGVTVVDGDGALSRITAHDGLPTSDAHAVAFGPGGRLYVGTRAGLAVIAPDLSVTKLMENGGRLRTAWVNALAASGDDVFAGTRGDGVYLVGEDGGATELSQGLGPLSVHPGALLVDGDRVFVGTAGQGLLVYERSLRRWRTTIEPMGSQTVTAVLSTADALWIGTDQGLLRVSRQDVDAMLQGRPEVLGAAPLRASGRRLMARGRSAPLPAAAGDRSLESGADVDTWGSGRDQGVTRTASSSS